MGHFINPIFENIWKDRYQKNGESYEDNLRRVAKFCANNEQEEEEFYQLMIEGKFFPGGRTMSNAGIGTALTLNNCHLAGTKVLTSNGYKNIEDIQIGELVATEDGSWQPVNKIMERDYEGDIIHLSGKQFYEDIYCTPNHEFLTKTGWVAAENLQSGGEKKSTTSRVKTSTAPFCKEYQLIDLLDYYTCEENERVKYEDNDMISLERFCGKNRFNDKISWMKQSLSVKRYLKLTPEFRYFIGRWLGDGSVTRYKGKETPAILQIVFNATTEKDAAEYCFRIGQEAFGMDGEWTATKQNTITIRWSSKLIGSFFLQEFGEKCDGKVWAEKYIGDLEIAKGLIDSDGYISNGGGGRVTLKNKSLIEGLKETLYLNGYNTKPIQSKTRKDYPDNTYWEVTWYGNIADNGLNQQLYKTGHQKRGNPSNTFVVSTIGYVPIEEKQVIPNQKTKVYNLSVENIHSYIVNGVVCHNCFVAPSIPDDLNGIFETVRLGALTHQRGGGIGYDFSRLRPAGTPTSNDAIASGPVSFADVFNAQTATILQGNRRGANMGVLNIYHPDIEAFIDAKASNSEKLKHFNLSVMVDDLFMEAVQRDKAITLHWPVYDEYGYIIHDSSKWEIVKTVEARKLWDKIMQSAYNNGEPGIFFYDNMNSDNNLWYEETIVCSNPCAEYLAGSVFGGTGNPEEYGGACNLGSLMLHQFVERPFREPEFNFYKLGQAIHTAVRFLDNIIDKNSFPSPIYKNYQERYRTIGLGYTGLADMLAMMGLRYDSSEARDFVSKVTDFIAYSAYCASVELAKEKGAFPGFDAISFINSGFIRKHRDDETEEFDWHELCEDIGKYGIRNSKLLSVAPTGTMSLVYGNNCSSGIEPIFSLSYDREVKIGGQSDDDIQTITVYDYAYSMYQEMKEQGEKVIPDPFITALDMSVDAHVQMLAAIAYNVDMSVSKTINVPTDYSFEACKDIYMECWQRGIKGCTIFRPNELRQGILIAPSSSSGLTVECNRGDVINCDDSLVGVKRKLMTGCGSMHLMAWYDPKTKDIMEVFVGKGSSGGCEKNLTAMTRLISLALRGGVPFEKVIDQLESCGGCSAYNARRVSKHDTSPGSSCATAIARALVEINKEIHGVEVPSNFEVTIHADHITLEGTAINSSATKCPECGAELSFEGGCNICKSCGWSKCG